MTQPQGKSKKSATRGKTRTPMTLVYFQSVTQSPHTRDQLKQQGISPEDFVRGPNDIYWSCDNNRGKAVLIPLSLMHIQGILEPGTLETVDSYTGKCLRITKRMFAAETGSGILYLVSRSSHHQENDQRQNGAGQMSSTKPTATLRSHRSWTPILLSKGEQKKSK